MSQIPTAGYLVPQNPICKIPYTAAPGYTELYINPCPTPLKLADRIVTSFDLAILDDLGNEMSFNYFDWACTLQFEFIPKIRTDWEEYFPSLE
jgi:hypothetical protein